MHMCTKYWVLLNDQPWPPPTKGKTDPSVRRAYRGPRQKKTQQNFQSSVNKKPQLLIQISKAKNNQYILAVNLFHQKSTIDGVCSSPELQVRDPNSQTRAGAPQRRLRRGKEGKEGRDSLKHCWSAGKKQGYTPRGWEWRKNIAFPPCPNTGPVIKWKQLSGKHVCFSD